MNDNCRIDLAAWGLSPRFRSMADEFPALAVGRVIAQEKSVYRVVHAGGEQSAAVSGKYRYAARSASDYPAVGDFVMLDIDGGSAVIQELLPRKSVFLRRAAGTANNAQVVAANVDVLFLCMALNSDFNLRRLERYLSVAWESGVEPVVLLTKADLCEDLASKKAAVAAIAAGVEILSVSCMEQDGEAAVRPYLIPGRTVALIGSSGVGKSTLLNLLRGDKAIKTGGLRSDGRGRHTTTRRELMLLSGGGIVIDTPGMRELGLWDAGEGLEKTFSDIEALTQACRFPDCRHGNEPGCAVRAALERGELAPERWASYRKLRTENAFAADSDAYLAAKELKFKDIAKFNKGNRKK